MAVEPTPRGTYGARTLRMPGPLTRGMQGLVAWFARLTGTMLVLTTTGARTGRRHSVVLGRFPEGGDAFLVVGSNAGSARHPAWLFNMAEHPDDVWAEVGRRKFKVRPELLSGAEREAAMERVVAASRGYASYGRKTDREIPVVRLVPE